MSLLDDKLITSAKTTIDPLRIGDKIPRITVYRRSDASPFDLEAALKSQPTILVYYRGSWCPYCNVHLSKLKAIEQDLARLGYQILAVSADRPDGLSESKEKHGMEFTLLSDAGMEGAESLGIAFEVTPETIKEFQVFGVEIEDASGNKHHKLPVPSVFLVDREGVIRFEYINPDFRRRIKPEVLLEQARKYRH